MPDTALQITSCETCCYYGKRTECRLNVISPRSPNNLTSKESWAPSTVLLELFTLCEGVMSGPWGGSALGYPVFDDEEGSAVGRGRFCTPFLPNEPIFKGLLSRPRRALRVNGFERRCRIGYVHRGSYGRGQI